MMILNELGRMWKETVVPCFNHLKPKLINIIFNNSVRTAKKTERFTITKINLLMLFNPLKTSGNYMSNLLQQSVTINFVCIGFV
jgi:hypothetical protein